MVQFQRERSTRLSFFNMLVLRGSTLLIAIITLALVAVYLETNNTPMQLVSVTTDNKEYTRQSFGLTVVHCREQKMEWLDDVPKHWKVNVYETCGENVSNFSRPFKNAGSEEYSAYLQTIIDQYDSLPDISVFVQSDVLIGHGRKGKKVEHSPFSNFNDLVNATESWGQQSGLGLLAYGPQMNPINNINSTLYYIETYPREIFDIVGLGYTANDTKVKARSGACFAVHRDRIRANAIEIYSTLQESILAKQPSVARKQCCGLENTWHAVLGESYILPKKSTVDHLWSAVQKLRDTEKERYT